MSAFAGCNSPRCEARRAAGDVAARLMVLPHPDYAELVILRTMPPAVFLDGCKPARRVERLDVGDPLRPFVCGHLGDMGARELAGNRLRHTAVHLAEVVL